MQKMKEMQVWPLGQENPWSRKCQPTPVFLPGKLHEHRYLAGHSPRGCQESVMTETELTSTYTWTPGYLLYTLGYNTIYFIFPLKLFQLWTSAALFSCLLWFFWHTLFNVGFFSCPVLESAIPPRNPWYLLLEDGIRNQDLGARSAIYYCNIIASKSSQSKELCKYNICLLLNSVYMWFSSFKNPI